MPCDPLLLIMLWYMGKQMYLWNRSPVEGQKPVFLNQKSLIVPSLESDLGERACYCAEHDLAVSEANEREFRGSSEIFAKISLA